MVTGGMKNLYVLAFVTCHHRVLLIQKRRPAWQVGKLNGLGGKIDEGETPLEAVRREVREEAGLDIEEGQFREFAVMEGDEWRVYCFTVEHNGIWFHQTLTDELVGIYHAGNLPENCLPSVRHLVPLALDREIRQTVLIDYRTGAGDYKTP
jgi:8-oxo-dGTP diphosphatase